MDPQLPDGYGPDDEVEHDSPDPVWLQLAAVLIARIERGDYPVRRSIPSETQLMDEFGIARGTARKSIRLLADRGYVQTVTGRGSYVMERHTEESPSAVRKQFE
ncbi:GntR family transcriptional regulator [Streptomyces albiaxialis]